MGLLLLQGASDLNPRELFSNNEQGLWLDPSDMTAGKAGWRRNLGINTDALSGSSFAKTNANVNSSAEPAPTGYTSVFVLSEDSATGVHSVGQASITNTLVGQVANQWNTIHFACKAKERTRVAVGSNSTGEEVIFDLSTGSIVQQGAGVTGAILSLGSGWYRCSYSRLEPSNSGVRWECRLVSTGTTFSYTGDGSSGVYISGFQFEISPTPSEYQRITDFSTEFKQAFPLHTLYQDSNGVTPCTDSGQPVGLILDQSRGGLSQIGADLVTNGGFAADTDWTKGANWTIGSGVATKTGGAANNLTQTIGSTAAAWYRISLDVTRSAGTLTVSLGTSGTSYAMTATGSYTFFILAGSGTQTLTLAGDSSFAGTVDNVVVKNVPGNHAYQTTSASRPTLARIPVSGRRNLLTRTEEFDNAAWTKSSVNVSANAASPVAPDGNATADTLTASGANGTCLQSYTVPTTGNHTFSVYLRSRTGTGTVEIQAGDGVYSGVTLTTDWARFSVTASLTAGARTPGIRIVTSTDAVDVWGAQLETGSTVSNYQKVVATTDVTESGVGDLWHLVFDGSDDSLVTNSVDFSATDEMTVIAGVRKLSDAASAVLVELSNDAASNNGAFALFAPRISGNTNIDWRSRGTATATTQDNQTTSPITAVVSTYSDISDDSAVIRRNGAQINSTSGDQGSGNYGNYILYIGRRGGSSLPFNGHIYQLIVRGRTTPTGKLLEAERFTAKKTGVTGI